MTRLLRVLLVLVLIPPALFVLFWGLLLLAGLLQALAH